MIKLLDREIMRNLVRRLFYFVRKSAVVILNALLPRIFRLTVVESNEVGKIREVWSFLTEQEQTFSLVRIGGSRDGGYFCPPDLSQISYVFSPGYGGVKNFEDELARKGKRTFICDSSYAQVSDLLPLQEFEQFTLSGFTSLKSGRMSLPDWVDSKVGLETTNMLLQLDIEGAEWEVLNETNSDFLNRFDVVLIEFHDLDRLVSDKDFLSNAEMLFSKLKSNFLNVYCRANNCGGTFTFLGRKLPKVVEITLINRFYSYKFKRQEQALNIVDEDYLNNPDLPIIKLNNI